MNYFQGLDEDGNPLDEFYQQRARTDVPHDDELQWDAHDRVGPGYSEMRGPTRLFYLVVLAAVIAAVVYLW